MKNFILFVAIVCGGASFLFFTAAKEASDGPNWASQVCKAANSLCHSPQLLAFTAAGFAHRGSSRCLCRRSAMHDPEKWKPVFGKIMLQCNILDRDPI